MRLLITGSSGFIGSKLIQRLRLENIPFDILKRFEGNSPKTDDELQVFWPEDILTLDLTRYSAVVHLASARVTQTADLNELRVKNVRPVEYFLRRISQINPSCSFIFVTSQSAKSETSSAYGKLKWEAEELIRSHIGDWTILRPGLVIGEGGKGLFNRLLEVVNKFPIIPLVGQGDQLIQPIGVDEVVYALVLTARDTKRYSGKDYSLVGPAISLKEFLQSSATVLGKKRFFVSVPISIVDFGLTIAENLLPNPPITKTNLLGLLNLDLLDSKDSFAELGISPPALKQTLESALGVAGPSPMDCEANFLYRSLFGRRPSRLLVERYIAAHDYCCFIRSPEQQIDIEEICKKKLDAESIEFATRYRRTLLSKKMTLLSYLAELEAGNYSTFVNETENFIFGFISLAFAVLRTPWKLLKGKYLVWRYNLV